MTSIEEISLHSVLDEHRHVFDRANGHLSTDLLKDMQFRRIGGIALAVARPFEGPSLPEFLEDGGVPIVRFLPWGNNAVKGNYNQPVQSQVLADIAGRPIIAMSSPSIGSTLELSREDRGTIARGDFSPVGREMLSALSELTERKLARAAFMGASQGAAFAIATTAEALRAGRLEDVEGVLAFGLPNVKARSRLELFRDFARAGPAELHDTLMQGGIPQLVTALRLSLQEPGTSLGYSVETTAKMTRHPVLGYALSGGMGKTEHIWQNDIPTILKHDVPITLISEGQGAVMPTESLEARAAELYDDHEALGLSAHTLGRLGLVSVQNGNHTMADHLPTVAGFLQRLK